MTGEFRCPTCGKIIPRELLTIISHAEQDIVEEIKKDHPDWVEDNGICKQCYDYYKKQLHP